MVTKDVAAALDSCDMHELDMRNKRLKRAADLNVKHTYLPAELQEGFDVWEDYLSDGMLDAKKLRLEQQAMGKYSGLLAAVNGDSMNV